MNGTLSDLGGVTHTLPNILYVNYIVVVMSYQLSALVHSPGIAAINLSNMTCWMLSSLLTGCQPYTILSNLQQWKISQCSHQKMET